MQCLRKVFAEVLSIDFSLQSWEQVVASREFVLLKWIVVRKSRHEGGRSDMEGGRRVKSGGKDGEGKVG